MQRTEQDTPTPLLMQAFGHASQQQTLAYLWIQEEEIEFVYRSETVGSGIQSISGGVNLRSVTSGLLELPLNHISPVLSL